MNRRFTVLLWFAVSLGLAACGAWIISTHFVSRPFASVFWPCLIGTVLVGVFIAMFNVLEAAILCTACVVVAVFTIPLAPRFGVPALPHVAVAAIIAGFASSRILHSRFFA